MEMAYSSSKLHHRLRLLTVMMTVRGRGLRGGSGLAQQLQRHQHNNNGNRSASSLPSKGLVCDVSKLEEVKKRGGSSIQSVTERTAVRERSCHPTIIVVRKSFTLENRFRLKHTQREIERKERSIYKLNAGDVRGGESVQQLLIVVTDSNNGASTIIAAAAIVSCRQGDCCQGVN